ncbi:DUF1330 domain-containing protein [Leptospira sp. GIMC2001]|uniref:DUF1330 domain-containing protein n=1 Tax=Leptospira sp. GIMC2001 TaxID=1513297 RepID=UPI00234AC943|nr:DUF1330 domain-containing protein [Leptospira sp. GIMC2001]WCL49673.1 DUF1330 domain-containing protein [Leptospira sp. GIMC2001]
MFESLVGLKIKDDDLYTEYRKNMIPILEKYEGGFRYDFKIQETLKSEHSDSMDRVFIIYFKDRKSKESFFSDPDYITVRNKFFIPAVESTHILSEYERNN